MLLTEGPVVERVRRHPAGLLDPHVANASLLFGPDGRELLVGIYRDYRDIGLRHGLPTLLLTPPGARARSGSDRRPARTSTRS